MGLADKLMQCVQGDGEFVALHRRIAEKMEREQADWICHLRANGVKAAHPDDGWVDRQKNTIRFQYPQFNDGVGIGDLVALGWPSSKTRIVEIIGREETMLAGERWAFKPADGA